jgi:SNF2 family DNA or RNA helicase
MNVLNGLANANIISPEAMYALTGGDVRGAMELMGCEITDDEDVIESLIRNFKSKLLVRQRHMVELKERLKEREEASDRINKQLAIAKQRNNEADIMNLNIQHQKQLSLVSSAEESIKTETQHIKELEQKIADIKARVEVTNDKQCPICISDIDMPTLTPCCNNLFCGSCLLETLKVRQTCPLCRQAVDIKQIKGIEKGKKKKVKEEAGPAGPVEELPTKLEGLFNIIDNTPDGRFLIFTQFDHVFNADALVNMFANRGITYEYLKGSASHIANIVERFNSGRLKVLILNTRFLGSGINLQTATDTIIFHKLSDDIEKQVIGRAQRPGRTAPLRVHFLYYDNEFDWG